MVMHTKNSVLSKALHLKMSQSGAILRVVNICVGSCGGAAGGSYRGSCGRKWQQKKQLQGRLRRHGSCRDLFGGSYRGSYIKLEGAGGTSV